MNESGVTRIPGMKRVFLLFFVLMSCSLGGLSQTFSPPVISGWVQDGEMKSFDRSNLFNHINGAAEFYYSYGFQWAFVVLYLKGEAEMTLEVYDHGDAAHAYGIYSMERPSTAMVKKIGAEGYYEENILNFVTGRFYVKISAYRHQGTEILLSTARELCSVLGDSDGLPPIVEAMPQEGLEPNSRQYVSNTFMGLDFLGSAYRASYKEGDKQVVLFVLERDSPEAIDSLVVRYHEFVRTSPEDYAEGACRLEDPFNGTIYLNQVDNYLIGFSGDDQPALRTLLLEKMKASLKGKE